MTNTAKLPKKKRITDYLVIAGILAAAAFFVYKFAQPQLLKLYIETGVGTCNEIPILCKTPQEFITDPQIAEAFQASLLPYEFPKVSICIPEGFLAIQERVKKVYYYGTVKHQQEGTVVYLLHQKPDYFIGLFQILRKQGINDDYTFIRRTMYATISDIKTLTDAFFVIIKGVFIPDVGDQKTAVMAEFTLQDKRGFINYNVTPRGNFFDCNIFDTERNYFKVYVKDPEGLLDVNKMLAIISTVRITPLSDTRAQETQ
jgi:hypothetical protein